MQAVMAGIAVNYKLRRNAQDTWNEVEYELAKERSSALGQAGRQLQQALIRYQHSLQHETATTQDEALTTVSERVYGLMLQREFLGFTDQNLSWICKQYAVPEAALKRLGMTPQQIANAQQAA